MCRSAGQLCGFLRFACCNFSVSEAVRGYQFGAACDELHPQAYGERHEDRQQWHLLFMGVDARARRFST